MAERIEVPPTLMGDNETKIRQLWSYLFNVSETLNRALQNIGGNDLTDRERAAVQGIVSGSEAAEAQSLRDLLVTTAEGMKKEIASLKTYVASAIVKATADQTTDETDFNDLTDAGNYWISMASKTHGPSELTGGTVRVEVRAGSDIVQQTIRTANKIYFRQLTESTWGSWYKLTGTSV